jgi:hypothetical protein
MAVILATQEVKIRMIVAGSQARQNSSVRPCLENTHHKKKAGRVAQGPELKPQ